MPTYYVSSLASGSGTGTELSPFTIAQAGSSAAANDVVHVKADGVYTFSSAFTPAANFAPTNTSRFVEWRGYGTTPGDGVRPVFRLATGATTIWAGSARSGHWIRSIDFDCNGIASSVAVDLNQWNRVEGCIIRNQRSIGVNARNDCVVFDCQITGGSGGTGAIALNGTAIVQRNHIYGNASPAVFVGASGGVISDNIIVDNTGASSDGIACGAFFGLQVERNIVDGNGRHGIAASTNLMGQSIRFNVLLRNGGFGLSLSASTPIEAGFSPNAYGSGSMANSSGNCSVSLSAGDVTNLSASPWESSGSGNYTLNNSAGGGAVLRAMNFQMPGISTTRYPFGGWYAPSEGSPRHPFSSLIQAQR